MVGNAIAQAQFIKALFCNVVAYQRKAKAGKHVVKAIIVTVTLIAGVNLTSGTLNSLFLEFILLVLLNNARKKCVIQGGKQLRCDKLQLNKSGR